MRKQIVTIVFVLLLLTSIGVANAENYSFENIFASVDIPEDYTVLLPKNLHVMQDFIETLGTTPEELSADFNLKGILLQAWSKEKDSRLEISAVETDRSKLVFDVDRQTEQVRGEYRTSYFPNNIYEGYEYKSSNWKNFGDNVGRFLVLEYNHYSNEIKAYTGYARKTIKNGYEISVDYKALNRKATNKDNKALNKIFKSWKFNLTQELSEVADAGINITKIPSEETKNRNIEIAGNAKEGVNFTAVVMSLGASEPDIIKTTANEKNKFSLPITFKKQGVFLITVTANKDGKELGEWAYPVTYKEGLLSVKFAAETPEKVYEDSYKIRGTGEPGAAIQVMLNNKTISNKSVDRDGKFIVPINTKQEGDYEVVLVFTKRNLETRRFKFNFTREISEEEQLEKIIKKAVNATYGNLTRGNEKFKDQAIRFNGYLAEIINMDDSYLLKIAYNKNNKNLSSFVYVQSETTLPEEQIGRRVRGVATLLGFSDDVLVGKAQSSIENLPYLKLISFE